MYKKERIYIVVKTYPTISEKYAELVCTAGVREDGSWVRLYPVPFRMLKDKQKYPKFSWIEVSIERNSKDFRPETYKLDIDSIIVEKMSGVVDWEYRKSVIFNNKEVFTTLKDIKAKAKNDKTSLVVFKPSKIVDFIYEEVEREWNQKKVAALKTMAQQLDFFLTPEEVTKQLNFARKLPYKFSYIFEDDCGVKATLMVEDWEIGMLYWNCLKQAKNKEREALEKVKQKYLGDFAKKDLYFFMGTTKANHYRSKNPFIIIGVFPAKHKKIEPQISMFEYLDKKETN